MANDTRIEGGTQNVYASGTANNSTVSAGGQVNLYADAQATGLTAETGGRVNIVENGVKTIDSLALNGGSLAFVPAADGTFKTLVVEALSGTGSILLNTQLSDEQGDRLVVSGAGQAQGDHTLVVSDSGYEPALANGRLMLIETNGGGANFELFGGHVDAGAFRYSLQQLGDDWFLANSGSVPVDPVPVDPVDPVEPVDPAPVDPAPVDPIDPAEPVDPVPVDPVGPVAPVTPVTPTRPTAQQLSKGANAAIGMHTATATLVNTQMNALVNRMGDLRVGQDNGGVWTRAYGKQLNLSEKSSRAYDQQINGIEIGADKGISLDSGKVFVGAMLGTASSNLNFGEGATGGIESRMVGAYATYLHDSGVYLDGVVKYSRLENDVKMLSNLGETVKSHYKTNGVGASVEVGKHIGFVNGWFVEPQLQVNASRTQGARYTASNGLKVKASNLDSLQSRIGSLAGRSLRLENGMNLQPYVKASYVTEHQGRSKVNVNGNKLRAELPGDLVELGFGSIFQISEKSKISLDAEYAKGKDIEQPWSVNLGYRYLW